MPSIQACSFERSATRTAKASYLLSLPDGYSDRPDKLFPLLLCLHGAGERGDDLELVKVHGPLREVEKGRHLPFVIVAPQCPAGEVWDPHTLSALLDEIEERLRIDPERIYVTGLSMGGYGTWALACHQPERFAAIVPICGGGNPVAATRIVHLPIWAVHGDQDEVVPLHQSQIMVERLLAAGAERVRFDVLEGCGHDAWSDLYAGDELYEWLLSQRRTTSPS